MPVTPRRSPAPRPPRPKAAPVDPQAVQEAAQAESLLAEVMCGTPRARRLSGGFGPAVDASIRKKQRGAVAAAEEEPAAASDREEDPLAAAAGPAGEQPTDATADDDDDWYADCVLARRRLKPEVEGGPPGEWQYLVRWVGKGPDEDRWVPESALDPAFLQEDMDAAHTERAMERTSIS